MIDFAQGDLQDPSHISDDGLGSHRSEGDDLAYSIVAVLFSNILDDLFSTLHAEVDVDIWQRDAVGVEEPLEDQVVLERTETGDSEAVGNDRAHCGTTTGTDGNLLVASVAAEIPHDQEVRDESHLDDHRDFVIESFSRTLGGIGVEATIAVLDQLPESSLVGLFDLFRSRWCHSCDHVFFFEEDRQVGFSRLDLEIDHRCDFIGIRYVFRIVSEELGHLFATAEVESVRIEHQPILVIDLFASVDAQVYFLSLGVLLGQVMDIIGRDDGHAQSLCQFWSSLEDFLLFDKAVILYLHEKSTRSEDVDVTTRAFFCFFGIAM